MPDEGPYRVEQDEDDTEYRVEGPTNISDTFHDEYEASQLAHMLNEAHEDAYAAGKAEGERGLMEAASDVLKYGLPSAFCDTECLGTCSKCKAKTALKEALAAAKGKA